MQRSLPTPSASRASPRNRRHYPPQLGSTHRKRSQHRPQSNRSLANLITPGVSKSLTRSERIHGLKFRALGLDKDLPIQDEMPVLIFRDLSDGEIKELHQNDDEDEAEPFE